MQPMEMRPPWLLFSQQTVCAELSNQIPSDNLGWRWCAGLTYQELPLPTPTPLRGEHWTPTRTSGSTTRSRRPRMALMTLSLALDTWLQQCTGPVLQLPLEGVPEGEARLASREKRR